MADKVMTYVRIDRNLLIDFKAVASKNGWKFQPAVEMAFARFVALYGRLDLLTIGLDEQAETAQAQMKANAQTSYFKPRRDIPPDGVFGFKRC